MATPSSQLIAEKVDRARKLDEVPVLRLADATGIPRTTLKRMLKGQSDFSVSHLIAVTAYLGIDCAELVREAVAA